jgi:murein DD-endopeptidase MepM/ murein hydrolase activator NlpD
LLRNGFGITQRARRATAATAIAALALGAGAAAAPAQDGERAARSSNGAVTAPGSPEISDVVCVTQCVGPRRATPGAVVKVKGAFLDSVTRVVFEGPNGPIRARQKARGATVVRAVVPPRARGGRPYVIDAFGERSNRSPRRLSIAPKSEIPKEVFPVRGPHSYGDGLGAGRGHDGVDVMASCGTRMVAALAGRVQARDYHSAAGYYVVIDTKGSPDDLMYAHLTRPANVRGGQRVNAGQTIGYVGETGNAQGCHLHFEYWSGDWYGGGSPIDAMPFLKRLDRTS